MIKTKIFQKDSEIILSNLSYTFDEKYGHPNITLVNQKIFYNEDLLVGFENVKCNTQLYLLSPSKGKYTMLFSSDLDFCKFLNDPTSKSIVNLVYQDMLSTNPQFSLSCPIQPVSKKNSILFKKKYINLKLTLSGPLRNCV